MLINFIIHLVSFYLPIDITSYADSPQNNMAGENMLPATEFCVRI